MMMSYKAAAILKQKSRTAKTILFHFGLFIASIVIIISDTDFATFGANNQVRNFWLSDFEAIADQETLETYLKEGLVEKFFDQDENGNVNKFSHDGSMIYLSDLNVRQLRSSDSKKFLNRWTLETKNFTSGWKPSEKDESDGTTDISGESDADTAWQHTPFWSGRHIKGEFSSQYPYSGYSIHVFAGDEESKGKLSTAIDDGWIDNSTRAVVVDLVLYCNPARIFTSVQLVAEIPPIGNIYTGNSEVRSFPEIEYETVGHYALLGVRIFYGVVAAYLTLRTSFGIFDTGMILFFSSFWRCIEVFAIISALSSQMYYTSQRAYTNIVWEKLEKEDYESLLKENPFKYSIVGDVAAAANAHRWQLAYLGFVIFFTLIKFMKILSGTHFFEMTKGTYFKAGYALLANVLFIFVVYFGFVHVARILFHRTADFSDLMRSADMVMGFCAGMYTSTDLRRVHHFRAGWYLVFLELIINCILMNTLAVILENSFRESKDQFEAASELHHMTRKHFRTKFANRKENLQKLSKTKKKGFKDLPRDSDDDLF